MASNEPTPQEIEQRRQMIRAKMAQQQMGNDESSPMKNFAAGVLNNPIQMGNTLDIGTNLPGALLSRFLGKELGAEANVLGLSKSPYELGQKIVGQTPNNEEPSGYNILGVQEQPAFNLFDKNKPFSTSAGRWQLAGELAPIPGLMGGAAAKVEMPAINELIKSVMSVAKELPADLKAGYKGFNKENIAKLMRNDEDALQNLGHITGADVGKQMSGQGAMSNRDAFDLALKNHIEQQNKTNNAWDVAKGYATVADFEPSVNYSNKSYLEGLQNAASRIKEQNKQSALARQNKGVLELIGEPNNPEAGGYMHDPHNTYSNMIEHQKALNADFRNLIPEGEGRSIPFELVNEAKRLSGENLQQNLRENGLQETLGGAIDTANQATKDLHDIYYRKRTPGGGTAKTAFSKIIKGEDRNVSPENFVNDFLPSPANKGVGQFEQLGRMIGNQNEANKIIIANHFGIKNGEPVEMGSFLKKYENLSPEQQEYLFPTAMRQKLQLLSRIKTRNPELMSAEQSKLMWKDIWPALLGSGLSSNPIGGALLGKFVGDIARKKLGLIAQGDLRNPENVSQLLQRVGIKDIPQANYAPTKDMTDQAISMALKQQLKGKKK